MISLSKACIFAAQEQCNIGRLIVLSSRHFSGTKSSYHCIAALTYQNTKTEKVKLTRYDTLWSTVLVRSVSYGEREKKQKSHTQKMIDMFNLSTKKSKFESKVPFDYSGDIVGLEPLKDDETLFIYKGLEEKFKEFPSNYSKVTTVEYADGQERLAHRIWKMQQKFMDICQYGEKSEVLIAKKTVQIRNLKEHCLRNKKDSLATVILVEQIQGRHKELRKLRKKDYKRFHWLLKELNLRYKPHPLYVEKTSRRAKMREYLRNETLRIIHQKIEDAYKNLENEKESFYNEKERQLAEIRKDLLEYNISDYEVLQNVKELRQQRVLDRKEKFVPKPNTFKWIPFDKEQKKERRAERDEHRRSLIQKGTAKVTAMESQL